MNLFLRRLPPLFAFLLSASPARAEDVVARLSTTLGDIEVRLFADKAPLTVGNFIALARANFYDGLPFHRVMPGYAIQVGESAAGGGPGYCFSDEFSDELKHDKAGILTMASSGRDSNGSQFLITLSAQPALNGRSPVFGEVTKGMDVVERLSAVKVQGVKPVEEIKLTKIEIVGAVELPTPVKTPELSHDELIAKVRPDVTRLLNGLGPSLGLGKLTDFSFESARSRCAESQVAVTANFEKKGGARLLIYGRSRGAAYSIEQFQWTR